MKLATVSGLLATLLAGTANAHYIFNIVIVNGQTQGGEYAYVRRNSNQWNPVFPDQIIDSPDLRCNVGAKPSAQTGTLDVTAGDTIGFKVFNRELIEHPGPGFVYMSRAPDGVSISEYDGSGPWFKVWETGLCGSRANNDGDWCSYNKDRLEFTIPEKIPEGEYLVRAEHIGLHEGFKNRAQFYMECAQFRIASSGGGTPSPLAEIPGIYKANDPGIAYDKWTSNPAPYVMPGPAVWDGN